MTDADGTATAARRTPTTGETRLGPYALGLGATHGYSGSDLTNVLEALDRGEVAVQPEGGPTRTLELRIHGIGGAPPEVNLESPAALQVAGDERAGFYRAWYPGGTAAGRALREAYCWGRLDTAWWTAFWLLLFPFGLYNLAHWALPEPRQGQRVLHAAAKALLRLQSLVLTGMLVATACYLALDMLAWQGPQRDLLPSFLGWYADWPLGVRTASASLLVFATIVALWWLSHRTQGDYEQRQSGVATPGDADWALSDRTLWCGARTVARQRDVHLIGCAAVILVIESLPQVTTGDWLRAPVGAAGGLVGLFAVALTLSTWTDRDHVPPPPPPGAMTRRTLFESAVWIVKWVSIGIAFGVAVSRVWWTPDDSHDAAIPYDSRVQLLFFWTALAAAVVFFLVVLAHRPWRQTDVMVRGFASTGISLLATLVATIFTASLLKTVSQLVSSPTFQVDPTPSVHAARDASFYLPSTAYSGGLAFGVALVVAAATGVLMFQVLARRRARRIRDVEGLLEGLYGGRGYSAVHAKAMTKVSRTIATSRLTDSAGVVLLVVAVPTFVVLVTYQLWIESTQLRWGMAASAGAYLATLATGAALGWVRSAVTSSNARRRVSFIWDVITFWPRACHPLGPPSYAERSVPEVVTRLRRLTGDAVEADRTHDPAYAQQLAEAPDAVDRWRQPASDVLVTGYSQGCPIAMAAVAQLPREVRDRVRLLTLASPARRLYGRAFPAYFGPAQLLKFRDHLRDVADPEDAADVADVRWTNLVRATDYIGGRVFSRTPPPDDRAAIDRWIRDPAVLWSDIDPSPPVAHLHSNWFSDAQVRPHADRLRTWRPRGVGGDSPAGEDLPQKVEIDTGD